MTDHPIITTLSAHRTRPISHRFGLFGVFLIVLGGLLLRPAARPPAVDATTTLLFENFDRPGLAGRLPQGWTSSSNRIRVEGLVQPASAPNGLFVPGQATAGSQWVSTPRLALPNGASSLVLMFRHRYNLERSSQGGCNDGALVAIQRTNSDTLEMLTSKTARGSRYTAGITSSANPWHGNEAWCGESKSWKFEVVTIPDPASVVAIRWIMGFDANTSAGDWFIDDVRITYTKAPEITFSAVKWDGTAYALPYTEGTNSTMWVKVTASCRGDDQPVQLTLEKSSSYGIVDPRQNPVVIEFKNDGEYTVAVTCSYPGWNIETTKQFKVKIASVDLSTFMWGPATVSSGSQVRYNASVQAKTWDWTSTFDLDIEVPTALGTVSGIVPPSIVQSNNTTYPASLVTCSLLGPSAGLHIVRCHVPSLGFDHELVVPFDVNVLGAAGSAHPLVARISRRYDTKIDYNPANDRFVLKSAVTAAKPDLTVELNAFAGIQPNTDNEIEVRVHNTGAADASGATVRVTLPAGLTYLGTLEPDACVASGQVLNCRLMSNVTAGWNDHIEILVRPTVPSGTALTVQATADAGSLIAEANETNNSATMPFTVGGGPAAS